ncbi:hypothetical protein IPM62_04030 [Candidatus Woesebacteria bacterium]|nr:MAG: hypothetical protein IPM62_04030 [Candidatus Woesebacteria bacterium]
MPKVNKLFRLSKSKSKNIHLIPIILLTMGVFTFVLVSYIFLQKVENTLKSSTFSRRPWDNDEQTINQPSAIMPRNLAEMSQPHEQIYSFTDFGIYSPQFVDVSMEKTEYKYSGAIITKRQIYLKSNISVNSWTIGIDPSKNEVELPLLPNRLLNTRSPSGVYYDFPILDGYEGGPFVSGEKYVSWRIPENISPDKTYINDVGINVIKKYKACPKSVCGVRMEFHTINSESNRQVFFTLSKEVDYFDIDEKELNMRLEAAFVELEHFFDTLSFEKY